MKVGVLLPTFRHGADDALRAATLASAAGLDGVFAYDHLWPMGEPQRPSLAPFPLLACVAATQSTLALGPLVARVGLVGTNVLVEQFRTLAMLTSATVIAALGTGDKLSEPENLAYGLVTRSANERRELISETARALEGFEIWVGAGASATNVLARELGAVVNFWNVEAAPLRAHATDGPVSWAGNATENLEAHLDDLADAGATWAVFSPAANIERLGAWRRAHGETL